MKRMAGPQRQQRGIATLVIVMVLFFVVSMVAAYTSRNLIFEQRTSANQYASTQAMEAAEAGIEWALGMLNHGRIDAACASSTLVTDTTFRDRYLTVNTADGRLQVVNAQATCVWNGSDWECTCPDAGSSLPTEPTGAGIFPAFRVRFVNASTTQYPSVVRVEANGCTRLSEDCLGFTGQGVSNEGRTIVRALLSVASALPNPPAAALTAGGNVNLGGAALTAINTDTSVGGLTVQARLAVDTTGLVLQSSPGTPGDASVVDNDVSLSADTNALFAHFFNMWPETHRRQPAAVTLVCNPAACTAAELRSVVDLNPGRPIWLQGDLVIDSTGDIGSATAPVLLTVEGDLTFTSDIDIYGLVYVRTADWATAGGSTVVGAVVAQGNVGGNGTPQIVYDRGVLDRLRRPDNDPATPIPGSFVRVPGGWRDY